MLKRTEQTCVCKRPFVREHLTLFSQSESYFPFLDEGQPTPDITFDVTENSPFRIVEYIKAALSPDELER